MADADPREVRAREIEDQIINLESRFAARIRIMREELALIREQIARERAQTEVTK